MTTTAHELLALSQMTNKGSNYVRLRESLLRLWRVGFLVSQAQYSPDSAWATYLNETLTLFDRVRFWTRGRRDESPDLQSLVVDGKLSIQLSQPLADSIRAGYTQSLDRKLLSQIEQPVGRATYRILQAHRPAQGDLSVKLLDWAQACGVVSDQPDKIRRSLQAAHDELQANAYLEGVEFHGRGSGQVIEYHFRDKDAADPALVQLLREQKIPRLQAENLARTHSSRVESVVAYVSQLRSEGKVKSPGGLTVDILQNPDKYLIGQGPEAVIKVSKLDLEKIEQEADQRFQEQQDALLQLSPLEQWQSCQSTLSLLLGKQFPSARWAALEQACISGQLAAVSLTRELTAILNKQERYAYLESLLPKT